MTVLGLRGWQHPQSPPQPPKSGGSGGQQPGVLGGEANVQCFHPRDCMGSPETRCWQRGPVLGLWVRGACRGDGEGAAMKWGPGSVGP